MKVIVVTIHAAWTPHYETDLEIIKNHLDAGDEVIQLVCDSVLHPCDLIFDYSIAKKGELELYAPERCDLCISKRKLGKQIIEQLGGKIKELPLIKKKRHSYPLIKSYTKENLRAVVEDNYDVGEAILSSIISFLRNPDPDLIKNKHIVDALYVSCLDVYDSLLEYIAELMPNRVYVFNGRLVHSRAVLRACQKMKVDCYVHERGHSIDYYGLTKNTVPHDLAYTAKQIEKYWHENSDNDNRKEIGSTFFIERVNGTIQSWVSFTDVQTKNKIPDNWDNSKENVVIFNSSEDEFEAIGSEWKNTIYNSQLEAVKKIIEDQRIKSQNHLHFYLRIHPNLKSVANDYQREFLGISSPNLTIIAPDSLIDSYALLNKASKVLTFGSTMGIEAVYWEKPSVLIGMSFYKFLNATYNPKTHDEVINYLSATLTPKSKDLALMYGYYMKTFGIKYKHFAPSGLFSGKFMGVDLNENVPISISKNELKKVNYFRFLIQRLYDRF